MQVNNYLNINRAADRLMNNATGSPVRNDSAGMSFEDVLKAKTAEPEKETGVTLKFSKHATGRLEDRNIEITDSMMERLTEGTVKARDKGIRETLVMVDSLAFIVNVPSQTVVTAMDQTETNENIFTNIDGAVIA